MRIIMLLATTLSACGLSAPPTIDLRDVEHVDPDAPAAGAVPDLDLNGPQRIIEGVRCENDTLDSAAQPRKRTEFVLPEPGYAVEEDLDLSVSAPGDAPDRDIVLFDPAQRRAEDIHALKEDAEGIDPEVDPTAYAELKAAILQED